MKNLLAIFIFVIIFAGSKNSISQVNLVLNPSFESYINNQIGFGPDLCDTAAYNADYWQMGSPSPDYMYKYPYNCYYPCCVPLNAWGYKNAFDGDAYYFFCIGGDTSISHHFNYESIQGYLSSPLIANKVYCLNFYISLADSSLFATNSIGAFFSVNNFYASNQEPLQYTPQVVNYKPDFYIGKDWHKIKGHFTALGGESIITIGVFGNYDKYNYFVIEDNLGIIYSDAGYYCDMITLVECDNPIKTANAVNDKIICTGDSITIGTFNSQFYDYDWQPTTGLSNPNSGMPNASPNVTTTYTLTQKYFDFPVSTDEVTITVNKYCNNIVFMPNVFSPNSDGANDILYVRGENIKEVTISLYNRWGEKVFESNDITKGWDGTYKGKPCPAEVYVYYVIVTFINGVTEQKNGNITLVR